MCCFTKGLPQMKWLRTLILFDVAISSKLPDWKKNPQELHRSISEHRFPDGYGKLKLRRNFRREDCQWERTGSLSQKTFIHNNMTTIAGGEGSRLRSWQKSDPATVRSVPSCKDYGADHF
jgi:hypothetical protein